MIPEEFLDRLVLDRVLLAGVEIVVWLVAPLVIVLVLAGLGAWTVRTDAERSGEGLLALAWAAVSGAVLVVGAVAGLNLLAPVPRWSPVVVVALGTVGLVRSARRLTLTPRVLVRLGAVMGATAGAYRVGYSPPTYDAFLYHGVIVEWLGREAVPQGFGLLHSRFAFNPGLALLMPAFRSGGTDWTHHVLVELAVVGLAMVVLVALLSSARERRDGPLAALLLALTFASALFLVLRQRGPGTDLAVAFTLVAAVAVAAAILRTAAAPAPGGPVVQRAVPERAGLFALLGMLAAFAILQKVSAAAVLVLLLAPVLARRTSPAVATDAAPTDARTLAIVLPSLLLALVAGLLHTVRTFVMSGCLAYPVAATCIERPWTIGADVASAESASIRSWARDRSGAHPELLDTAWLADWAARYVRDETFVVLALGVVFGLLGLLLRRLPTGDAVAVDGRRDGLLWASVGVSALLWAASAPAPRFGIHLHLVVAALLAAPAAERLLARVDRVDRVPGAAERATASVWRPSAAAVVGVAAVLGAFGVGMIAEGRQLPVSGSVPHPMRSVAMPIAGSTDGWDYLAPVGSDQCGDAFPCAPSERDLVVDVSGPRLAFRRPAG